MYTVIIYYYAKSPLIISKNCNLIPMKEQKEQRQQRNWRPEHSRLPELKIKNNIAAIKNIRNCIFHSRHEADIHYFNREFDLEKLERLDLVYEPFGKNKYFAHTFLSFGFSDGRQLALSIEARRGYRVEFSALKGLLNYFELIYIFADEQEILSYRVRHLKDRLYLLPLDFKPAEIKKIFLHIGHKANCLKDEPHFYHSIKTNCTNQLIRHINGALNQNLPLSWHSVFTGKITNYLRRNRLIKINEPFRLEDFCINQKVEKFLHDQDFSRKIRKQD